MKISIAGAASLLIAASTTINSLIPTCDAADAIASVSHAHIPNANTNVDKLDDEDSEYWARLVQEVSDSVAVTEAPTPTSAPTTLCLLDLAIACEPPILNNVRPDSCEDIPQFRPVCEQRPSSMEFVYSGMPCTDSSTVQGAADFGCEDSNGGPSSDEGAEAWIVAFALGGGEVFHDEIVTVGDAFAADAQNFLTDDMRVNVYTIPTGATDRADIVLPANLVQTVRFSTACDNDEVVLKDRFGSLQVVTFENEQQGAVSCFTTAMISFVISLPPGSGGGGAEDDVTIDSFVISANSVERDLTNQVGGQRIGTGPDAVSSLQVSAPLDVDLTSQQRYTVIGSVNGGTDGGQRCVAIADLSFVAGNVPPGVLPTLAPTIAPTLSQAPTPGSQDVPCGLDADVTCVSLRTRLSCDQLVGPSTEGCLDAAEDQVTVLAFVYLPVVRCDDSNTTATGYTCTDFNDASQPKPDVAYIEAGDGDGNELFFADEVTSLGLYEVPVPPNTDSLRISIFDSEGGELLQLLENIDTRCRPSAGLRLQDTFGAAQLMGYETADEASYIKEILLFTYTVTNTGPFEATVTVARRNIGTVSFGGLRDFVNATTSAVDLDRSEVVSFNETRTINLKESVGTEIDVAFAASGVGTVSQLACTDFEVTSIITSEP